MRRRTWLVLALATLAVGVLVVGLTLILYSDGGSDTFDRIEVGMSVADVEAIVGKKADVTLPTNQLKPEVTKGVNAATGRVWLVPHEGLILAVVDSNGIVVSRQI